MNIKPPQTEIALKPEYLNNSYVFDGREVRLTGRVAKQKKRTGRTAIVWEICSLSIANASPKNTSYNKWVNPYDLFHIGGENLLAKMFDENEIKNKIENSNDKPE